MATDVTGVENVMGEVALFWQLRKFQFIEEATDFWMNAVAPKECFGDEDPDLDTTLLLNQFFTEWLLFEMPYQESTLVGITALRDEISAESRNVLKQIAETQRFSSFKMQWLNPHVAGVPCKVGDTNGAGDTFFGAALSKLCKEELDTLTVDKLESILAFANKAASITTSRHGAIPAMPTLAEVEG